MRLSKQGSAFCFPEHISRQANKLFSDLKTARYFSNLPTEIFVANSAHFLSELNAIHAFREGNGRTQLTFLAMLAERSGHPLDFGKLDPDAMLDAMIASFHGDESKLIGVISALLE